MLSLEEMKLHAAHAPPGSAILPMSVYLHNHLAALKALEENDLTPARLQEIAIEGEALVDAVKEIERRIHKRGVAAATKLSGSQ